MNSYLVGLERSGDCHNAEKLYVQGFFQNTFICLMLCSPTQSTDVLCAGMEIPMNPVMLVSTRKLLPGLNDDLQGLPKEWLL